MCNQDRLCDKTRCCTGVKLKGPDDEDDELDEAVGSPQSSPVVPSAPSPEDGSLGEQDGMSANALAEDERTAEAAGSLKDESQVSICSHSHAVYDIAHNMRSQKFSLQGCNIFCGMGFGISASAQLLQKLLSRFQCEHQSITAYAPRDVDACNVCRIVA